MRYEVKVGCESEWSFEEKGLIFIRRDDVYGTFTPKETTGSDILSQICYISNAAESNKLTCRPFLSRSSSRRSWQPQGQDHPHCQLIEIIGSSTPDTLFMDFGYVTRSQVQSPIVSNSLH